MIESPRWADATQLVRAFADRSLSPVDVVEDILEGIGKADPELKAFVLVDEKSALASARKSATRWEAGTPIGPLDGVPATVKDLLLTKGWPTLRGSNLVSENDSDWAEDAPSVARLRESGAVLIGKVTSPEFGWKGVTDSPRYGATRNPWDSALTSGGSSGGSAAAVAAGLGQLSIGTDGGGSIRIPAGFCGVVGFKPTYGRVPLYPASPFGTLAHAGPITRTVADTALMLDVISGFDPRDWSALPAPELSFSAGLAEGSQIAGLKVAYSRNLGYGTNSPEVEGLVTAAVGALANLGAHVDEVGLSFEDPARAYHTLWFSGAAMVIDGYGPGAIEGVDPKLRAAVERHADFSAADFLAATNVRMELGRKMGLFHQEYDILVTPTLPDTAFTAALDVPEDSASPDWTSWTPYSYPFNLTQQPAITVPCGFTAAGLPVGLQIIGPRHSDARVLGVAAAYEAATDWMSRRPTL